MKIFISYQQTWIPEKELRDNLLYLRNILKDQWIDNFIYFLDEDSTKDANYIVTKLKQEIKNSDIVLAFTNYDKISEWQLLELGFALWNNKKIIFLVKENLLNKYYLIYWFDKIDTITFGNIKQVETLVTNYFNHERK